jgi:GT2 family glycosyltransferase
MAVLPVIIVSYKTERLLRQCLTALARSEGITLDITVVDNHSQDTSLDMLCREFPTVRVLPQNENRGFAKGVNVGLRSLGFEANQVAQVPAGSTPLVLLLNPDTEVRPDAIRLLVAFMDAHPAASAVGPQLIYPDGRFQHSSFAFPGILQIMLDFYPVHHRLLNSRLNGRYPRSELPFLVDHPLGACMLVRAAAIQQVGLLDEGYFMYVEEVDWCRRMHAAGWQIWTEPRAVVVHHEGQSTRQFREAMVVQLWRSRLRYYRKFYPPAYVACVRAAVRWGLRGERRKIAADSTLDSAEREKRLAAFREVESLWTVK